MGDEVENQDRGIDMMQERVEGTHRRIYNANNKSQLRKLDVSAAEGIGVAVMCLSNQLWPGTGLRAGLSAGCAWVSSCAGGQGEAQQCSEQHG